MGERLASGGVIDRNRPVSFEYNGRRLAGFAGDTLASALLANDVRVVGRSFKYRRPRGIYGIGAEEPNAVFSVGDGASQTPNQRATLTPLVEGLKARSQSGWPSPERDLGAPALAAAARLLPAGFYYKTFMRPAKLWKFYEKFIRRAASQAQAPAKADPSRYLHQHAHCDVLVAGGGPAGLAAAMAAAKAGARVILANSAASFGGQLLLEDGHVVGGQSGDEWAKQTAAELAAMPNVTLLPRATAQGYHDYNYVLVLQETDETRGGARACLWKIRARRVVVAAGAIERPPVFAGNDSPGVMLASAVRGYLFRYGVLASRRVLFLTNNDSAYAAAIAAARAGADVEIADIRNDNGGHWRQQAKDAKIVVRNAFSVLSARDQGDSLSAQLGDFYENNVVSPLRAAHTYGAIAVSGGWTPSIHLFAQAGGKLQWNERIGAFCPASAPKINPCVVAGAANGVFSLAQCLQEGAAAGAKMAAECGFNKGGYAPPNCPPPPVETPAIYPPFLPGLHPPGQGPHKHFVDLMNDVTVADIMLAAREGYESVEHMKRYTAAGFGTDQGKTGNINAFKTLAKALGKTPAQTGHTTYRPNYTPVPYGAVAGGDVGENFAQRRATPIDPWHQQHNAVYEDVGDWARPRYFPQNGENMQQAVLRECRAARNDVALMDASTLGKIDIYGKDAAKFLDMVYTNLFSNLPIGKCRYGLMLRETGMIFDDGVTARLAENRFHLTTSTGHAAAVMNWLEEWLQTEWPQLRVFCNSVTEQWAVVAVVGPKARQTLAAVCDAPLAPDQLPFMGFCEATVAGAPARVFRVSFSGESAFEVNVPARYGLAVWEALYAAGKQHNITPYGTETMHVLRAEKGYIIVGQDADGTCIPSDVGLQWMVSKKKEDFLGKRSLARPDMLRDGRLQLAGLLPENPQVVIGEGAQVFVEGDARPQGHVTSSYLSDALGRSFALAMIANGTKRHGETAQTVFVDGARHAAKIVPPVFWDKEGKRLHG